MIQNLVWETAYNLLPSGRGGHFGSMGTRLAS